MISKGVGFVLTTPDFGLFVVCLLFVTRPHFWDKAQASLKKQPAPAFHILGLQIRSAMFMFRHDLPCSDMTHHVQT